MTAGLDIAPQAIPVPMNFAAPPPMTQQGTEDVQQSLGGLAGAIQQKLATSGSVNPAKVTDAPMRTRKPPFPNPMQAWQLDQAVGYA